MIARAATVLLACLAVLTPSSPAASAAPSTPSPRPVAVVGDFGSGDEAERRVADLVAAQDPVAVVTTGDNVYDDRGCQALVADYYGRWMDQGRFWPAAGNHDHEEGIAGFDDCFPNLRGRHVYQVGAGGMRFFVLDSTTALDDPAALRRQKAWLKRSLETSRARWKVVVLHHPPYSSSSAHGSTPEFQWPFGRWGADLVLSGHDHVYERLADGTTTFVVNGAGGKDLYDVGDALPASRVRFNADHGALFLTASRDRLDGVFRAVDGRVIDRFALRQS